MPALIVLTNFPDRKTARQISTSLVKEGLAVCVSLIPGAESLYLWNGELQNDPEVHAIIKTRSEKYQELETSLRRKHPYDVPEIIALAVENGNPAYFEWIDTVLAGKPSRHPSGQSAQASEDAANQD